MTLFPPWIIKGFPMVRILHVIDWISLWSGKLCGIPMFIVVFIVLYEVIARYVFSAPTQWANEMMLMGCGFVYVIGGAWVLHEQKHVKMELLYDRLSPRGKAFIDAITFACFMLYLVLFLWVSGKLAWESLQLRETTGSSWNPPIYPMKIALTVGVLLLILQGVARFIRDLYFLVKGKEI